MGGQPTETSIPIGDWTIGSLKAYHDMMIAYERQISDERDKRYDERWKAQEVASTRYQVVSNEFRKSLDDLSIKQATKLELGAVQTNLNEKVDNIILAINALNSRLDIGNPDIRTLQNQQNISAGMQQQADITWGKLLGAVGAAGAIGGLIARFL